MNIVYVSREFGSITGGGIGTYIENVTRGMAVRGHNVFLVTDCFNHRQKKLLAQDVTLVPTHPTLSDRKDCYLVWLHEYADRVYHTLKELSRTTRLDVVEFPDYNAEGFVTIQAKRMLGDFAATTLAVKLHTPTEQLRVLNEVSFSTVGLNTLIHMENYAISHADLLLSPSEALARYAEERYQKSKVNVARNPLEPRSGKWFGGAKRTPKTVLFAGTIQPRKGLDVFIQAANLILERDREFQFHIAGQDTNTALFGRSYQRQLEKLIPAGLEQRFRWHGRLNGRELTDLYHRCQFCVFPSRWENYPNVCIEAMSHGCVVLGSTEGGMPEMIEDGRSGFLISPADVKKIAAIILEYDSRPDDLSRIGRAAEIRAEEFRNPEKVCREIEQLYRLELRRPLLRNNGAKKVSVVIPLYNQGEFVEEAIASVRASDYPNIEIIVVNDGSTEERTNQIFERLGGVVKLQKKNGGLGSARNAGLMAATGDYILPLDADDRLAPDLIRKAVMVLDHHAELAYVGCYTKYFGTTDLTYLPIGYVENVTPLSNTEGSCTKLFRREALRAVGMYDEQMIAYEDWDLILRLNQAGFAGDIIPEPLFFYRRRENSMNFEQGFKNAPVLMQHMHRKIFKKLTREQMSEMNHMLVEQWKVAENRLMAHVHAGQSTVQRASTIFQVFWGARRKFSEKLSVRRNYVSGEWLTLKVPVTSEGLIESLRVDPCNHCGMVRIKSLSVRDTKRDEVIWCSDTSTGFSKCRFKGTANMVSRNETLLLWSSGEDPQIWLPKVVTTSRELELCITLRFDSAP